METEVKIIANYLPQYHQIPENDKWWGTGYTDWVAVKRARPSFVGHIQPKEPLDGFYYDLSKTEDIKWQADLAKKYGIYGFGIYHYWFSSDKELLSKPSELILENKDIDIHYMFIWDNNSWTRTWKNIKYSNAWAPEFDSAENSEDDGMLAKLEYGGESEWEAHFKSLLPHFKDKRYIKINNKPVFAIFRQDNNPDILRKMASFWDDLAKKEGFDGIYILGKHNRKGIEISENQMLYEPCQTCYENDSIVKFALFRLKSLVCKKFSKPIIDQYDQVWERVLKNAEYSSNKNTFLSGFVGYDDTPRRGKSAKVILGADPEKFKKYLTRLLRIAKKQNKQFVFLTAWNEWGEGAYLEPDKQTGFSYLEAIRESLSSIV